VAGAYFFFIHLWWEKEKSGCLRGCNVRGVIHIVLFWPSTQIPLNNPVLLYYNFFITLYLLHVSIYSDTHQDAYNKCVIHALHYLRFC
jgi:hypothetical protein